MSEDKTYLYIVVAEKPSVARSIARVLKSRGVNAYVTSVRGHVLNTDFPEGYEWNNTDPSKLFSVRKFRNVVSDERSYKELEKAFKKDGVLIIATDNDSEGELIGYEILSIYRANRGNQAPYKRMRFNSTNPGELWRAWNNLEDSLNMNWVMKAMLRQHFDLVTGAAFTRLLTKETRKHQKVRLISWGSCQSPTLGFIVNREKEIISFKPEPFWYIRIKFRTKDGEEFEAKSENMKDVERAKTIWKSVYGQKTGRVLSYDERQKTIRRPLPLDTDTLLKDLTKITGISAATLLSVAEELYAEGYCSYPRTETNRFGHDFDFKEPIKALAQSYLSELLGDLEKIRIEPFNGRKDDGAHPPIYPIKPYPKDGSLKQTVWEYIARRFAANVLFDDAELRESSAEISVGDAVTKASGAVITQKGFFKVFGYFMSKDAPIPKLSPGEVLEVVKSELKEEKTRPPPRLTESALLELMEKNGIGTDATRAEYPKIVVERGYAVKRGKSFYPTELGMRLVEALSGVDERLVTPDTRKFVEEFMEMVNRGTKTYDECLEHALKVYEELYRVCEANIRRISETLAGALKPTNYRRTNYDLQSNST
ncbi:MAG: type IA DNA topoisomerase [Nitrososphaerota archaeon]|nr:type IA DNA topoisomerase [Aigarchaeota archaeon]MDW8076560.1 type IA DNA topoisomerase [Nitrososphaerota archaeon]